MRYGNLGAAEVFCLLAGSGIFTVLSATPAAAGTAAEGTALVMAALAVGLCQGLLCIPCGVLAGAREASRDVIVRDVFAGTTPEDQATPGHLMGLDAARHAARVLGTEGIYLVTPNEQEKQAIDTGWFEYVITTLGEQGCQIGGGLVSPDNEGIQIPAIHTQAVDTTGAGDTFNGVLAVCLAEGMDITTACRYAVTASGISVSRKHVWDAIPYREEIERRSQENE